MVYQTIAIKPCYGFNRLLPGKVIVQIAVDGSVPLQFFQALLQIADGVHHKKVRRTVKADMVVSFSMKFLIGEEIHKALEHADTALDYILAMSDDSYVLSLYTSFIIGIAHLITACLVLKGNAEIMPPAQLIVYFTAISSADVFTDVSGTKVRQQGVVAQFSYFHVPHFFLDRTRTDTSALQLLEGYAKGILVDAQQYHTDIARMIEVLPQFYDVTSG